MRQLIPRRDWRYLAAMTRNRSVLADTVLPHLVYRDLADAIAWLTRAFGLVKRYRYGNPPAGAQARLGNAWLQLRAAKPGQLTPAALGYGTQSLTIFIDDVETHYARAKAAGAKIVEEPRETEYGELQYAALDLDGHHWLFSRHARDVDPADWGATVVGPPAQP
jgi:uncharacterized glyoxalase superfamily protein PhnB